MIVTGCINKPQNPAATQPATAIDPVTTQPSYWLNQPAAAQVQGKDFDTVWAVSKETARGYLCALDREDYRAGLITTVPLVSKQWFEPWRPDTGTAGDVWANSTATIRRTLRFEIDRGNEDGTFTITPKVLVEREAVLERRLTSVSEYRQIFSGPRATPAVAITASEESDPTLIPTKYWYPIGRDTVMEKQVAERVRKGLEKARPAVAAVARTPTEPAPAVPPRKPAPLTADGAIAGVGPNQTVSINLGSNDKIVPGMTFEVYDNRAAIPPLNAFGQDNPGSKGWIEVTTVNATGGTARVIKQHGRNAPATGDQIFNFIYEKSHPNHFVVIGDFATADRETLTGLIWRWNGVVDNTVTPQTAYLLMGRPPKDAPARELYDAAYNTAQQLNIPVIDEPRFNLLIRYYDPAKR
jgi:hypothetical protein